VLISFWGTTIGESKVPGDCSSIDDDSNRTEIKVPPKKKEWKSKEGFQRENLWGPVDAPET